jgi:hypothetical protein
MFSVITNIYKNETKRPTLVELFTAKGKLKTFFWEGGQLDFLGGGANTDVRCVHRGWHGTHRYDIQVLATHASTWVHRYSSLLHWSVPLGQRGHVGGSFAYFARNARCTLTTDLLVWYSNTQNDFSTGAAILSFYKLASPSGRNMNCDKKTTYWGKDFWVGAFYLYRFFKYVS